MESSHSALLNHSIEKSTGRRSLTPLEKLNAKLFRYIEQGEAHEFQKCLDLGANANSFHPKTGESCLSLSIQKGNRVIFDILLSHSVNIEDPDFQQKTPLHYAAVQKDPYFCDALIKEGADIDCVDSRGMTPLDLASDARNTKSYTSLLRASGKHTNISASALPTKQDTAPTTPPLGKLFDKSAKLIEQTNMSTLNLSETASIASTDCGTERHSSINLSSFTEGTEQTTQKATSLDQVLTLLRANNALEINLSLKHIQEDGFEEFCQVLGENESLTSLTIRDYKFGLWGISKFIAGMTSNTTIEFLKLSHNRIGNDGVTLISNWLALNPSLKELWLDDNNISSAGCTILSKSLSQNKNLTKLVLRGNPICDSGIERLAPMLTANSTLQEVYLGGSQIGDAGMKLIGHAVRGHKSLTKLDLSVNQIGEVGASHFLMMAGSVPCKLCYINLENNMMISEQTLTGIKNLCRRNIIMSKATTNPSGQSLAKKSLTRKMSDSQIQRASIFRHERPKHIFVQKFTDSSDMSGIRLVVPKTMEELYDLITRKLDLPFAARTLFTRDGIKIENIDEISDQMTVAVSTNEGLRSLGRKSATQSLSSVQGDDEMSNVDSNASSASIVRSRWARMAERPPIVYIRKNGHHSDNPVRVAVQQIMILRRTHCTDEYLEGLWQEFLDDVTRALDSPARIWKLYTSTGSLLRYFEGIEDKMELFASIGDEFKPKTVGSGRSFLYSESQIPTMSSARTAAERPPIIYLFINGRPKPEVTPSILLPKPRDLVSSKSQISDNKRIMNMILFACTDCLKLPWAARRLFTQGGREILQYQELSDGMKVFVSKGEDFRGFKVLKTTDEPQKPLDIRLYNETAPRKITVYRNSQPLEKKGGQTVLVQKTFALTLDECTYKLQLINPAKRIFLVDGEEIKSLEEIKHGKVYVVTCGEPYYRAKEAKLRDSIASVDQEENRVIQICKNGEPWNHLDPKLCRITVPKSLSDLLDIATNLLQLSTPARIAYLGDGKRVSQENLAGLEPNTILYISRGENFIIDLESRLVEDDTILKQKLETRKAEKCVSCFVYVMVGDMYVCKVIIFLESVDLILCL
eukprot:TRINITY_DN4947_c0_g1_i3.p1 TRINITY_DN4947_c0_g1~~TRINITY_DN4947_c0_g1_i3.p1  ORF type:complete len:1091 (-),score=177.97 TRINITY_DN4947_c0_g1_i3:215-3487(-)